ncbi:copper amine oxidase N-terminal domain-containing protein [Paenibacillus glycinis]|uniref:Copper amine oxidase N-terminal domain-containing protein n=1 Tax=Paenibacillus glycinis TaxID=2697035 RepID=A0ABW9XW04_9BACL|nr:copper amine oxidase N-terminal domain-containing protein [Paenibacillus glycinis]NBD26878.1 copper amine oxidase N-terminal domain-containing protein [Paenibacillus glycinis]
MKKLTCALALLGAVAFGSTAAAADPIGITWMGKPVQTDAPPIADKGRVLIPLRAVSEALGADVAWNRQTRTVTVDKWTEHLTLTPGQQVAVIEYEGGSKETVRLDVPVKAVHDRIYVPLRFVSERFGYRIEWTDGTVSIKSPMSDEERKALYAGDLATARKIALKTREGGARYEKAPLQADHPTQNYNNEFIFPEGEALRFIYVSGGETATLFEFKDDFLVATWQARLDPFAGDSFVQLLNGRFKDATGPMPDIGGSFYYYDTGFSGPTGWEDSGRVGADGQIAVTASVHRDAADEIHTTGTIAYALPQEVRKETVKVPRL